MRPREWIEVWALTILRWRWLTLAVVGVLTALAAFFVPKMAVDTSLETWFLEDDATIVTYKEFRRLFGEDEFIVLAVQADDVFTTSVLAELARLTDVAQGVQQVRRATSLTNVEVLKKYGRTVRARRLVKQLPQTDSEAAQLRLAASSYPLVAGNLVSADGRAAAILIELAADCDTFEEKAAVVRALLAATEEHLAEVRLRIAGSPVLNDAISRYIERDLRIVTPVSFLIVVLSTLVLFRRVSVPLISLAVVGMATLWVLGVMAAMGLEMNLLGPVLIMIILVVGVADSVHIFSAYFQELEQTSSRLAAMQNALRHVLVPCLFTSLTTMAGFLSLLTSQLEPIRRFGALAGLGTGFAFLLSVFLIPALIFVLPAGVQRGHALRRSSGLMNGTLRLLGRPTRRASWIVLIVSTLILVPGAWSVGLLQVTANPMNYFHQNDPVRNDAEAVDTVLGGAASLEFLVRAPGGGMKDLAVLEQLDEFEAWLKELPAVTQIVSFGNLLKEANRVRRNQPNGLGKLPSSNWDLVVAKNLMQKASPDLLDSYVQDNGNLGRISVRVQAVNADSLVAKAPEIENLVRTQVNGPNLHVEPTGFVIMMQNMRSYLIRSQITSILLAFATITLMLMILFRSWKLALFSMIPNLGPIVLGLALMVVAGVRLDPGTVMIATIALGLVVDDTCHFLVRLREQTRYGKALPEAIAETMQQTGRPIILTSLILAAGFAALILGSFTPTLCVGMVSTFVLLMALVADLVVLPAALLIIRPKL